MMLRYFAMTMIICLSTWLWSQENSQPENKDLPKSSAKPTPTTPATENQPKLPQAPNAEMGPQPAADDEYHTPRAGEALKGYVPLIGVDFEVPARDRSETMAISLGAALYAPKVADDAVIPFLAFYYADSWQEHKRRVRMILAIVANFIDFNDGTWNDLGVEAILGFENYTLPISSTIEIEKKSLEDTEIFWGYVRGAVGLGWRTRISPWQVDNNFSIGFTYEPGLFYFKDTSVTADNYLVPPTTYEDRFHLKVRMDALERNIMEMRHSGWAAGLDAVRGHRYHWRDHDFNGSSKKEDTETYYYISGFGTIAGGPAFLSEKHRFIFSVYWGLEGAKQLDRYSAPRLGGGPGGDESEALSRCPIPGMRLDEFVVSRYLLFGLEYRLELLFFTYLHIKGTIGPIRRMELDDHDREVAMTKNEAVGSIGVALTTGFIWDSQLYLEYVHDRGLLRGTAKNEGGHNVMFTWSKSF